MDIKFFGKSDIGKTRRTNEDFFLSQKLNDREYIFIVADGMGGHQAGDVASELGTNTFLREYKLRRSAGMDIREAMEESIYKANDSILQMAASDPRKSGMGTTFSACVVYDSFAHIIHVGDSRVYMVRDEHLSRMTRDQTFVEKMVEEGRISEEEAREHPQKNILYMSLGAQESFEPEARSDIEINDGDIFVICSDGLNNMISDDVILEYTLSYPPEEAVERLIEAANDMGGMDNITILIVEVGKRKKSKDTEPIDISELNHKKKKWPLFFFFCYLALCLMSFNTGNRSNCMVEKNVKRIPPLHQ
jgi:protein phosphatase